MRAAGDLPFDAVVRLRARCALCALLLAVVAGCSGDGGARRAPEGELSGTLTVLAASSLTEVVREVADAFEGAHPAVDVSVSFDGSDRLAAEILEGVPGDVFIAAGEPAVSSLRDAGRTSGAIATAATNRLQIAVAQGNPLGVRGLADLGPGRRAPTLALCEPSVPCGGYAVDAFARAGLPVPPATEEGNVRGVLTKVRLGEVDAGIVYVTDVRDDEEVDGVDLPPEHQVRATYPAVVLADASNPRAAAAFVAFLSGPDARTIFVRHGFGPP